MANKNKETIISNEICEDHRITLFKCFPTQLCELTLEVQTSQNGQTHSNNSPATANTLFECVWPFCGFGT